MTIIYQSRELLQVVFIRQGFVSDLHEADPKLICLIVNILQLLQGLYAFLAFRFIYMIQCF
jgi:hypothetical protein